MTDRKLEQKLEQALDHAAPNDMEGILSRCGTRKGTVLEMKMPDMAGKNNRKKWGRGLVAAVAVALAFIGGGSGMFYWQVRAVASVVSLDVNPSIELRLNRNGTVLSCTAMNKDAAAVLYEMGSGADLEGIKLDVAVNAIVGALLQHGYLDSISSAILISVEDSDQRRAARIQEELVNVVDNVLQKSSSQSAVYSQKMTVDAGMETQAQNNNISSGKAYMINQAIALNGSLEFDALAALSVEELRDLIRIGAPGMPIGMDAAAIAAEEYAGTDVLDSNVVHDVDPELDEAVPHYEVELYLPGMGEFEYRIDAFTGAVLSGQQDILSTAQSPGDGVVDNRHQVSGGNNAVGGQLQTPEHSNAVGGQSQTPGDSGISDGSGSTGSTGTTGGADASGSDIGADAAKEAALVHAGLSESQVSHLKVKRDWDDGRLEYEVEFKCGGYEYEYTISGASGAVLDHEMEWDD